MRLGFDDYEPPDVAEQKARQRFADGARSVIEMLRGLIKRLEEKKDDFRKCPKCNLTFKLLDYCLSDGTPLVALTWDPEAPTLRQ